jgi:hypothetical protein
VLGCELIVLAHDGDKQQAPVKTIMNFGFNKNEEFPELFQEILPSKS